MEFEKVWKSLKDAPEQQAAYLRLLQPAILPSLFKNALTPPVVSSMLSVALGQLAAGESGFVLELLSALTRVPRFEMTVMCLPGREIRELQSQWQTAADALSPDELIRFHALRKTFKM
jgi:hypothetical protein